MNHGGRGRASAQPQQRAGPFDIGPPAQIGVALAIDHPRDAGQVNDAIDLAQRIPQGIRGIGDVAWRIGPQIERDDDGTRPPATAA